MQLIIIRNGTVDRDLQVEEVQGVVEHHPYNYDPQIYETCDLYLTLRDKDDELWHALEQVTTTQRPIREVE